MNSQALIDGEPAELSMLDERAFQFGDGLFETLAVVDGKPCQWQGHMRRLELGCQRLHLPTPDTRLLYDECLSICSGRQSAALKIYWTGGRSERGYRRAETSKPSRIVRVTDWAPAATRRWHITLCKHPVSENPSLARIKHLNRLDQVIARAEWDDPAIDEGLMRGIDGRVLSGTMSNLFVQSGNRLATPDLECAGIAGVVRSIALDHAASGNNPVSVRNIDLDEVLHADALYLTNSLIGVVRVGSLQGVAFNSEITDHPAMRRAAELCHNPESNMSEPV